MVQSPPLPDQYRASQFSNQPPHTVAEIDAGSTRLQSPKIHPVKSRAAREHEHRVAKKTADRGVITAWETPYNRPAFETAENVQYTKLAAQYLQQGRIEDAERLYKQALIVAERTFEAGDAAIFRAIEDLAGFYYNHEKYKLAEPLVERLLEHRIQSLSCDDWLLIRTVDQLAEIYEKNGEIVQAQALYKFLVAKQEDSFGRNCSVCAFTLSRLADSYLRQNLYGPAEVLMLRILEIQETVHGRSSIEISTTLQELSRIYQNLNRYDQSAEMLERLLHILESIHGEHGLAVASCLLKLADLLFEIGMVEESEPLYQRAQEIYKRSYGDAGALSVVRKKQTREQTREFTRELTKELTREFSRDPRNHLSEVAPISAVEPSRASKDKPSEQEECNRFPALSGFDRLSAKSLELANMSRAIEDAPTVEQQVQNVERELKRTDARLHARSVRSILDPILDPLFIGASNDHAEALEQAPEVYTWPPAIDRVLQPNAAPPPLDRVIPPGATLRSLPSVPETEPVQSEQIHHKVTPLSSSQVDTTVDFSRPMLYPEPFPSARRKSTSQALFPVTRPLMNAGNQ